MMEAIANAERQCIRAVASGDMKLMFALRKYGLNYTSRGANSQQYNRLRREIKLAKSVNAKKKWTNKVCSTITWLRKPRLPISTYKNNSSHFVILLQCNL